MTDIPIKRFLVVCRHRRIMENRTARGEFSPVPENFADNEDPPPAIPFLRAISLLLFLLII